jgi:hypothetical protein
MTLGSSLLFRMTLCVCFSENGPLKSGRYVCPFRLVVCVFMSIQRPQTKKSLENIAGLWRQSSKRYTHPAYKGRGPLKITDIHRVLDITSQVNDEYEDPMWLVRCDPLATVKLSRTSIGNGWRTPSSSSSSKMVNFTDPLRNQPGCHKNGDKPLRRRWDADLTRQVRVVRQERLAQTRNFSSLPFDDAAISPLQRVTDRVNELVAVAAPLGDDRARLRPGPCAHLPIVRKSTVPFASPSQRLVESYPPLPSISHPRIDLRRATGLRARLHS